MLTVRVGTWVNGSPTEVERFEVFTPEEGMSILLNIGQSWKYNINFAGYLYRDDTVIGRLDIFQDTYRAYTLAGCLT